MKRTDYKLSLVRAVVSINLALPLYQIAPMESDGMSPYFITPPEMLQP